MNRGDLDLLSSNLSRLDELVDDEAMCAKDKLTIVESLLDLDRVGALGRGSLSLRLGDSSSMVQAWVGHFVTPLK